MEFLICSRRILAAFGILLFIATTTSDGQVYRGACDKDRNANLPFCNPALSIDARVQSLISSLALDEKIGLLDHTADGASLNVELDDYNWWSEALHGVASSPGVHFRPPTEFATAFPQVINLAASFNKQLFFEVGNATGNEARAFYNVGNAGLTFWSPNINIYRDPRWGRGHETPGEDPRLNSEFARAFIKGMEGEKADGFLKTSACCKHFSAHSLENDRFTYNAVVNDQDMADTYLPAFRTCVEEVNVSCVMCAYNAVNGIPACADKGLLTGLIREKWGFDGYIVSDCAAVAFVQYRHNYTQTESETCHAVFDSGVDIECYAYDEEFYARNLRRAVDDGSVPVQMLDTALSRAFKVLMRLGYFEKDETRPFKDLVPSMIDSQPHQALALDAARQSIVLLKNAPNQKSRSGEAILPIDATAFRARRASMALIGPHVIGGQAFLGNYHGIPSFIKEPVDEIRRYIPDVEYEFGCNVTGFENNRLQQAEDLARASEQVVLFVGIDAVRVEREELDRVNISLPGLQNELIRRVLAVVREPVILFVVSGGALDLSEWQNNPRVGAIIWAGYLGQATGEAMADVMFGVYNPSGRVTQTFYAQEYLDQVSKYDMNVRPVGGSPGRTYRFFTGEALYPFGYGLSYTTFQYTFATEVDGSHPMTIRADADVNDCVAQVNITVRNSGQRAGDHSVLWFLSPPNAGQAGRPLKFLLDFVKLDNILPLTSQRVDICLNREHFQLANEGGEFEVVLGQWKLSVGSLEQILTVI